MPLPRLNLGNLRSLARALAAGLLITLVACSGGGGGGMSAVAPTIRSIEITPNNPQIAAGTSAQLVATAIFSDGSHQDVTSNVTWTSSNEQAATVSNGLATGLTAGSTTISASTASTIGQTTLAVTPATLMAIEVTPPNPSVAKGSNTRFKATGVFSDRSTQDLTSQVNWVSSNPAVATVTNAAGSAGMATATGTGATHINASLNGITSAAAMLTVTAATLVSIQVTPPSPSIANGLSRQFAAVGTYSDNSTQDLTAMVTWSSSDTNVATIDSSGARAGLAVATGVGASNISASLDAVTSPVAVLTVTAATLMSIEVTPPSPSIANGLTQQFTATGVYTDNSTQNVTTDVTWASSDATVAGISNAAGSNGLATAAGVGTSTITATSGAISSPPASMTVTGATLVSIQVTPPDPGLVNGLTQQFTAVGTFTDNSTQDLTGSVVWASSDGSVASISNATGSNGLATALSVGSADLSASLGGVTSPAVTLTVSPATLVSIQVTPPSPSIANGLTQQFTAIGIYTDNSTQDLTTSATWASSSPAVASVSNATGSNGLATGAATGSTDITASFAGVSSSAVSLAVTAATLVSIQVTPPSPSIANGLAQQFKAMGIYTDNSAQDLTSAVTWATSNSAIASISNAAGSSGLATSAGIGSTDITASLGSVTSPVAALTVSSATLVSIQVTPPTPGIANGMTQQFFAIGTYTDNSTQDLTDAVTWASTNTSVASISNASGSNGLATSAGVGSTDITATAGSVTSPVAALSVSAATLVSIEVTPPGPVIAKGTNQQFAAIGTYTDGSTQDLTGTATWSSSNPGVATVSNAAGTYGLAAAAGVGSADISASLDTVTSPAASLTVTGATLVSLEVTPASASIANGQTQQFTAIGTYTDSSTQDLTTAVTWASSSSAVATVSNAPGSSGLATAAGIGSANISASLDAVAAPAATLTVTAAVTGAAGVWSATPAAGTSAFMLSDAAGDFFYYTSSSTCMGLYTGTLIVSGSTVTGSGDFTPDVFGPVSGCPSAVHVNYSGTVSAGTSMTLTATPNGGGASSTINWTFNAIYSQGAALSMVAGTWSMPGGSTAVISATGAITAHDATTGCSLSGQLSVPDPTVNVYDVSAQYSGCTGSASSLNGVAMTGLATLDTSGVPRQFDAFLRSANKKKISAFSWTQ